MFVDIYNTNSKYDILYMDPPWKFGGSGGYKWNPANFYYKTMTFDEIKAMRPTIDSITNKDCLLFLWVVSAELPRCIEVGEALGFKYITVGFVWYKQRANVGNYTMSGCELCLIFKKGRIPKDRVRNPGQKQFYSAKIEGHSKKPDEIADRIAKMFPISKKLELFARTKREGWDHWGDMGTYMHTCCVCGEKRPGLGNSVDDNSRVCDLCWVNKLGNLLEDSE